MGSIRTRFHSFFYIEKLVKVGFFRELLLNPIKLDKMAEKAIDTWFQFVYVFDLAKGTVNQHLVVGIYRNALKQ